MGCLGGLGSECSKMIPDQSFLDVLAAWAQNDRNDAKSVDLWLPGEFKPNGAEFLRLPGEFKPNGQRFWGFQASLSQTVRGFGASRLV